MKNQPLTLLLLVLGTVLMVSCVKDVDFDQAKDLTINTPIEASIIHIDEPVSRFIDENGVEYTVIRDSVYVDIFTDNYVVDNLTKAEFLFEVTNTINRAYGINVDFYDDSFNLQHQISFEVSESSNNQDVIMEYSEVFQGPELDALKSTTNLVFTLYLQPSNNGTQLSDTSSGNLKLKSKATFYIDVISP